MLLCTWLQSLEASRAIRRVHSFVALVHLHTHTMLHVTEPARPRSCATRSST